MTTYSAGMSVDTYCTRCKLDLAHTIVAVVAGVPARVLCNTCRTERKYRRKAGAKKAAAPKKAASAGKRVDLQSNEEVEWTNALQAAESAGQKAQFYNMSEAVEVGMIIDHRSFGLGVVQEILASTKARIRFKTGERTLVHNRG